MLPMCHKRSGSLGFAVLLAGALVVLAGCEQAHSTSCAIPSPDAGRVFEVVEVVDGDTVVLDDRSEVRMVGLQAPKLPLGRRGFEKWPLADEAQEAAVELLDGQRVVLWSGGAHMDRHGRRLAQTYVLQPNGGHLWFQQEMLRLGLARVYSFPDNRACLDDLLAAESEARDAGRGMWALAAYRILAAEEEVLLGTREGSYELVQGQVREATLVRGRAYLNFGTNYRDDFTATIAPRDMKRFREAGIDPVAYEGRIVRVRGWLRNFNGPSIDVTHPEQIEVLE